MGIDYYPLSDRSIAQLLGRRLKALRLRKNRSQEELAAATTLSVSTIKALETGRGKLENFIAMLRELDSLDALDGFIPEPAASPLELAKRRAKERRRAAGGRKKHSPPSGGESW
jgi:transcriptional regulator with XRE-family HTH domain